MLEDRTIKILKKSGWYEGRKIDITSIVRSLEDAGYEVFDSAKKFFEEFGELTVTLQYELRGRIGQDEHLTKYEDLEYYYKKCCNYNEKARGKTIPICLLYRGEYIACISESGKFFISEGLWATNIEDFWNGLLGDYQGGFLHWVDYKAGKDFKRSEYKNKNYY